MEKKQDYFRVPITMPSNMVSFLENFGIECKKSGGHKVANTEMVRALIKLLMDLDVDKFMAGGQIINTEFIENYPGFKENISGFDLMQSIIEHCKKFNITIEEYSSINKISIYENPDEGRQT